MSQAPSAPKTPYLLPGLLAICVGLVGVTLHTVIVTVTPALLQLACAGAFIILMGCHLAYMFVPLPRGRRLVFALVGGVLNVLLALFVWFALHFGASEAIAILTGGPGAIWETIEFLSTTITLSMQGSDASGGMMIYMFWVPELIIIFLLPALASLIDLS